MEDLGKVTGVSYKGKQAKFKNGKWTLTLTKEDLESITSNSSLVSLF